jgi:dTDP-4-dehydrorhamnose 3,5-epimerase
MKIEPIEIPGVFLLTPARLEDERGWLMETYRYDLFAESGIVTRFVQDSCIFSAERGTVRGLHFQGSPQPQDKLVRCTRGAIFDVAVDIRQDSPTFGRHVAVELDATNGSSVFIPTGLAHGFCTLTANCEVVFKLSAYQSPTCAAGILWHDAAIGVEWPVRPEEAIVSERDRRWPLLFQLHSTPGRG